MAAGTFRYKWAGANFNKLADKIDPAVTAVGDDPCPLSRMAILLSDTSAKTDLDEALHVLGWEFEASPTTVCVPPGPETGARVAALASSGAKRILFEAGDYEFSAAADWPFSDIEYVGVKGTRFVPAYSPSAGDADDPFNALVRVESSISGADDTTMTVQGNGDEQTITVDTNVAAVNDWIMIRSTSAEADIAGATNGTAVVREEIAQVTNVAASGADFILTLDRKLANTHGIGSGIRLVSGLVQNVRFENIDFALEGGTIAVGLLLTGVVQTRLKSVSGAGASRALVHPWRGCRVVEGDLYHRGQNNAVLFCIAAHEVDITFDYDPAGGVLGRFHANGIPRGLATYWHRCRGGVARGKLGNGCTGVWWKGCQSCVLDGLVVEDILATRRIALDPLLTPMPFGTKLVGAGLDIQVAPGITESEQTYGGLIRGLRLVDCRVPNPDDFQAAAVFEDCTGILVESLQIENTGRVANPAPGVENFGGLFFFDSLGTTVLKFESKGVENALTFYGSWNRVQIDSFYWDNANGVGTVKFPIRWAIVVGSSGGDVDSSQPSDIQIDTMTCTDIPERLVLDMAGVTPLSEPRRKFDIRRLVVQNAQVAGTWDNVRYACDVSAGAALNSGDVMQLRQPAVFISVFLTDVCTSVAHGFLDMSQVYVRADAGGTLSAPLVAGTKYYIRDATANTFKLALTPGGAVINLTTDSIGACSFQAGYPVITTPLSIASLDKVCVVAGALPSLPAEWPLVAFGPMREMGVASAGIAFVGESLEAVIASRLAAVVPTSTDPIGITIRPKTITGAGTVLARK